MEEEAAAKNKIIHISEWKTYSNQEDSVPRQPNDYDCGLFVLMYTETLINTEEQLSENRLKLAKVILRGSMF